MANLTNQFYFAMVYTPSDLKNEDKRNNDQNGGGVKF